eukprot:CAMPEP_0204141904 /NCGR_PEP_ID=MMETSP0361-20130328/19716_1 /ASSEMBLY_ACC=CAM_ASM_000343 /TAXON_ID=268821 /ORGANISM="Scrippsiella Hangoei, Strain SHTV-5" /LENGTH=45 /DNA_ID= /DNA_START= /DNA_END= /DNA_ORIENTATION=
MTKATNCSTSLQENSPSPENCTTCRRCPLVHARKHAQEIGPAKFC